MKSLNLLDVHSLAVPYGSFVVSILDDTAEHSKNDPNRPLTDDKDNILKWDFFKQTGFLYVPSSPVPIAITIRSDSLEDCYSVGNYYMSDCIDVKNDKPVFLSAKRFILSPIIK